MVDRGDWWSPPLNGRCIRLYVEGGGKGNSRVQFRAGFRTFLRELRERAVARSIDLDIIPGGGGDSTWQMFLAAQELHPTSRLLVLLDSDGPVEGPVRDFLRRCGKVVSGVREDQCHLMVEVMEAWLIADPKALHAFYGPRFKGSALRKCPVENYPKNELMQDLKSATRDTKPGTYHKIQHGARLLEEISPHQVCQKAAYCARLFETVIHLIEQL